MSNKLQSEQLSYDVREIISHRPHWFIRNGNILFLLVAVMSAGLTFLIKYPDVVNAKVHIVAANAPKLANAKENGKLEKILVANEQVVKAGDVLAYLQSTVDFDEVTRLKKWIEEVEKNLTTNTSAEIHHIGLPVFTKLGELQPQYEELNIAWNEIGQILSQGYYTHKKNSILSELSHLTDILQNSKHQKELAARDYELQFKEFTAKEQLLNEKVIAVVEFNQDKSKLIAKEQSVQQGNASIANNLLSLKNKRNELLELEKTVGDQKLRFQSSLLSLKSRIAEWTRKYIICAPESGQVFFVESLQENQLVETGKELFYIQKESKKYSGEMLAGQAGFGKIKLNQKVIVKLDGYPTNEFGYLEGTISYISNLPTKKDSFLIRIDLHDGLVTNYGKQLEFRNNLSASAEIITSDRPLLYRLLGGLLDPFAR